MAYPKEKAHKEYMDYVIQAQSNGEPFKSFEEWDRERTQADKSAKAKDVKVTALSEY